MKSLQESLFSKDIVTQKINIDFDFLKSEFLNFFDKHKKSSDCVYDKRIGGNKIICFISRQSKQQLGIDGTLCKPVDFTLYFGIEKMHSNNTLFFTPQLFISCDDYKMHWQSSTSDNTEIKSYIFDKIGCLKSYKDIGGLYSRIYAGENCLKLIKLFDKMMSNFESTNFKQSIDTCVKTHKKPDSYTGVNKIPGPATTNLLKELIPDR